MQGKKPDAFDRETQVPSLNYGPRTEQPDGSKHRREAPRFPLPVRAVVEIPGLPPRDYGVCEVSRSGMFLAFLNVQETQPELERSRIGPGMEIAITFEVTLPDGRYHCGLPAHVVRITHAGVGVYVSAPYQRQLDELIAHLPPMRTPLGGDSA